MCLPHVGETTSTNNPQTLQQLIFLKTMGCLKHNTLSCLLGKAMAGGPVHVLLQQAKFERWSIAEEREAKGMDCGGLSHVEISGTASQPGSSYNSKFCVQCVS